MKVVRKELKRWVKTIVKPDPPGKLSRRAKKTSRPGMCSEVVLWIDSMDFRVKGKRSVHRKKEEWSHKTRSPARRWVTICDARACTQWISKCHLPTHYDGDIVISNVSELESLFSGLTMIGDNHFRKSEDFFTSIKLVTNKARAGRPRTVG